VAAEEYISHTAVGWIKKNGKVHKLKKEEEGRQAWLLLERLPVKGKKPYSTCSKN